ncbi:MAG: 23S rRNA methyltransferase [Magnetococcales bacterium]|nr:23S rRNA methyltransferase [Magnetococcales bacterium]
MSKRRPSSGRWLQEHHEDPYVLRARREGYRSRAAYKLLEIDAELQQKSGKKSGLLRPGMTVVDLGAAPGGWSQVAVKLVGKTGRIIAVDLLAMEPIVGGVVFQGDFLDDAVLDQVVQALAPKGRADLVLSDMAPNMSGFKNADMARGELLAEAAFAFIEQVLEPGGATVIKLFQGTGFHEMVKQARTLFDRVKVVKPNASRARSSEHYLLGLGYKGQET